MTAGRKLAWPRCTGCCLATPTVIKGKKEEEEKEEEERSNAQQDEKKERCTAEAEGERMQEQKEGE